MSTLSPTGDWMADSPPRRRRWPHEIMVDILKAAADGEKKTRILFKARLSFPQLRKYLKLLSTSGFITEKSGVWKTTEKGFHVIEACEICRRLMEEGQ